MKLYTRKGDNGQTQLIGGTAVQKHDPRLECYGTIDELNSLIGVCRASLKDLDSSEILELKKDLVNIQNYLFTVGSHLACEDNSVIQKLPPLKEEELLKLEYQIDQMTKELPSLKKFILPGGCLQSAFLHNTRTVCRRAEREVSKMMALQKTTSSNHKMILCYLNRLSDYFFVTARFINYLLKIPEQPWKKE